MSPTLINKKLIASTPSLLKLYAPIPFLTNGHVETIPSAGWYYSNTPWTDPALGGQ
jgi:hypothetical protein